MNSNRQKTQTDFFSIAPWRVQMLKGGRTVVWFSCGVTSAVALKLALEKYKGCRPVHAAYTDPGSEDSDNHRFMHDVERWLGVTVEVLRSKEYKDVDDVVEKERYLSGPDGAKCTAVLKKAVRHDYERADSDIQVFGFDARPKEIKRAQRFREQNPEVFLETPLIEAGLTHVDCIAIVRRAGIVLPLPYRVGFNNANCKGCLKAGGAGYWNKVRRVWPDVFWRRAKQERELDHALVRIGGKPVFLDELPEDAGNYKTEPDVECGILCGTGN